MGGSGCRLLTVFVVWCGLLRYFVVARCGFWVDFMVLVRVDAFVCFFVCVRVHAWVDCSLCCSFALRWLVYLLIVWCCFCRCLGFCSSCGLGITFRLQYFVACFFVSGLCWVLCIVLVFKCLLI